MPRQSEPRVQSPGAVAVSPAARPQTRVSRQRPTLCLKNRVISPCQSRLLSLWGDRMLLKQIGQDLRKPWEADKLPYGSLYMTEPEPIRSSAQTFQPSGSGSGSVSLTS